MTKQRQILILLLTTSLVVAACDDEKTCADDVATDDAATGDQDPADDVGLNDSTAGDDADVGQAADLTFYVITHGDSGPFWSVVERGVEDASRELGVTVIYQESNNDPEVQVGMIETAIDEEPDGIAVSLPAPDLLESAVRAVVAAGIPLFTLNSGINHYQELGAVTHVGQSEGIAGNGAGERFNALGATHVLCAQQEENNVGLDERCQGLAETFEGDVTTEFIGFDFNMEEQEANIVALLEGDATIDAVLGTGPVVAFAALFASGTAERELLIGAFDLFPEMLDAIEAGDIAFTIDQQQYLQGYLPVVLMYLHATNLNTVGGGLPILTGPGFVDADNADAIRELVEAGTR